MNMQTTAPDAGDIQTRAARLTSIDANARTFDVVWTTGASVRRFSWTRDEEFDEQLVVEAGAVRLDRLNAGAPFLASHRNHDLGGVLGVVVEGSARIEGGKGYATIRLSEREDVEPIWQDIKAGIIRHVSAGYRVHKFERIAKADRKDGGERALYRAVDWEPVEISAVAIGADPAAGVRGEPAGREPVIIERAQAMISTQQAAPVAGAEIPARVRALAEGDGVATRGMLESRATVLRILGDLAERHSLTDAELRRGVNAALAAADDAAGERAMRDAVLGALAERDPFQGRIHEPALGVRVGASWDSPAAQRAKLSDARAAQVCDALGLRHEPTSGRELAGLDAVAQARWLADQRGERGLRSDRAALDWFTRTGAGSHGTSDFPAVASTEIATRYPTAAVARNERFPGRRVGDGRGGCRPLDRAGPHCATGDRHSPSRVGLARRAPCGLFQRIAPAGSARGVRTPVRHDRRNRRAAGAPEAQGLGREADA